MSEVTGMPAAPAAPPATPPATPPSSEGQPPAPASPPATPPSPISEGSWRDSLSEDLRSDPALASYNDVESLAKSHINAQKMIGNNVGVPGKDASDEEWGEFYAKTGRPDDPDGYQLTPVEGQERLAISPESMTGFRAEAHRLGLSQRQADGLMQFYLKEQIGALDGYEQRTAGEQAQGLESLKQEWGGAYEEKIGFAREAAQAFGDDSLVALLDDTGYGNHPVIIKTFEKIGRAMKDDQLYGSGQPAGGHKLTPAEAKDEIGKLHIDSEFMAAYTDRDNAGHEAAMAKMTELHRAAAAGM